MRSSSRVVAAVVLVLLLNALAISAVEVQTQKLPSSAYRPQVSVDPAGTIHVVYAHRNERGNLYYIRRSAGEESFSEPILVNSTPNCAAAFNMSVGRRGRVHVVIRPTAKYSKDVLRRAVKFNDLKFLLYCRLSDDSRRFELERDLSGETFGFEGVGTVIADAEGGVYVYWHGLDRPGPEPTRGIYVAHSSDEGESFSAPKRIDTGVIGTCACCSMTGAMDEQRRIYLAFRNSEPTANKDSYLLTSQDGQSFQATLLEPWANAGCPGSVYSLAVGSSGVFVAWDTLGQIRFAKATNTESPVSAPLAGKRSRTPRLVSNSFGDVLFVWSEAGEPRQFMKGADLAWQMFDAEGQPTSDKHILPGGIAGGWSMPAAYAKPNGDFVILYDGQVAHE